MNKSIWLKHFPGTDETDSRYADLVIILCRDWDDQPYLAWVRDFCPTNGCKRSPLRYAVNRADTPRLANELQGQSIFKFHQDFTHTAWGVIEVWSNAAMTEEALAAIIETLRKTL